MRRVLQVITSFDNGAVPHILLDLAPHWRTLGWEPSFLSLKRLDESQSVVKRTRDAGFDVKGLNRHRLDILGTMGALRRELKCSGADVVHSHLGRADLFTAWTKPQYLPQVATFHSVRANFGKATLWGFKNIDKKLAFRSGVSHAAIDSMYADGNLVAPHGVIYNPVDLQRLVARRSWDEMRTELGIMGKGPILLSAGRFVEAKGLPFLLAALPELIAAYPDLVLILAGAGPLELSLRRQAKALGIEAHLRWPGFYPHIPDLVAVSDLLVFPSLWEGLGLVPLEAMLQGLPVVASDIPAIREFIDQTDCLFEPGNVRDCGRAIIDALPDLTSRRKVLVDGRDALAKRFDSGKIAAEYVAIYDAISSVERGAGA